MITELHDGTFYAEIELARDGEHAAGSRPGPPTPSPWRSATATPVPIFADEDVLDEAGVLFEADEEEQEVEQFREFLDQVTPRGLRPVATE